MILSTTCDKYLSLYKTKKWTNFGIITEALFQRLYMGKADSEHDFVNNILYTASGQKYSNTTKLTCSKCDIYCVSAKLWSKKVIGIFKYLKYIVLAITFVKNFEI